MLKVLFSLFIILQANSSKLQTVNSKDGVAVGGVDVVAYFDKENKKAVKGSPNFSHTIKDTKYYFSTAENLEKFKASPQKYLPAYGGFCAWAVEESSQFVPVDYDSFLVEKDSTGNERLLLFYNKFFINTKTKWSKKASKISGGSNELINKADSNWKQMLSSSASSK